MFTVLLDVPVAPDAAVIHVAKWMTPGIGSPRYAPLSIELVQNDSPTDCAVVKVSFQEREQAESFVRSWFDIDSINGLVLHEENREHPKFAERLKTLMFEARMTQSMLAAHCGVTQPTVYHWLRSGTSPRLGTWQRLIELFPSLVD